MKKPRTWLSVLIGFAVGALVALCAVHIVLKVRRYLGPPHVTLMNVSGDEISDITISLGQAKREIPLIRDGQAIAVPIRGEFSECSTHVEWTDSAGQHSASAGDYMEANGLYDTTIVITPDRKVRAVSDAAGSSRE